MMGPRQSHTVHVPLEQLEAGAELLDGLFDEAHGVCGLCRGLAFVPRAIESEGDIKPARHSILQASQRVGSACAARAGVPHDAG